MKKILMVLSSLTFFLFLSACSPEIGTKAWCEGLADKAKGEWSTNDATQFAKHCVLKNYKD